MLNVDLPHLATCCVGQKRKNLMKTTKSKAIKIKSNVKAGKKNP